MIKTMLMLYPMKSHSFVHINISRLFGEQKTQQREQLGRESTTSCRRYGLYIKARGLLMDHFGQHMMHAREIPQHLAHKTRTLLNPRPLVRYINRGQTSQQMISHSLQQSRGRYVYYVLSPYQYNQKQDVGYYILEGARTWVKSCFHVTIAPRRLAQVPYYKICQIDNRYWCFH